MLKGVPLQNEPIQKRVELLVFFGPETPQCEFEGSKPWKARVQKKPVVWDIKRVNRSRIATCRRDEETKINI